MEKEIWTIDDIIKDYENKGMVARSKIDFLKDVKDFILKNTRYVQLTSVSAEENEKIIKEVKEKMKNKDFSKIDYLNPGNIPEIFIPEVSLIPENMPKIFSPEPFKTGIDLGILQPEKYLKWEDLETTKHYKCSLNGTIYNVRLFPPTSCDAHQWEVRLISDNVWHFILEEDKQFFDDLHLVVIK